MGVNNCRRGETFTDVSRPEDAGPVRGPGAGQAGFQVKRLKRSGPESGASRRRQAGRDTGELQRSGSVIPGRVLDPCKAHAFQS